VTQPP
jgi:hypothetical protein